MPKIKIENFGAIKNCDIDIKKVTLFIGNQGTGKSTIAKLISTFMWIEKALVRGDITAKWLLSNNNKHKKAFENIFMKYHLMENYTKNNTKINYEGDIYRIIYENEKFEIKQKQNKYSLPQIMYIPAERNFISNVKKTRDLKLFSHSLMDFLTEFNNAKQELKTLKLPINNAELEYDKLNDIVNIKGSDYKVKLTESASGFQSIIPLFLVTEFLTNSIKKRISDKVMSVEEQERFKKMFLEIQENNELTDEQKRIAISGIAAKFNKTSFINIVEEPEQNLYPEAQWELLKKLLEYNNLNEGNKLIMTTHSPYMINFLSIAIQANMLQNKIKKAKNKNELLEKIKKIIDFNSTISENDLIVYQLKNGKSLKLSSVYGIPSDDNYLNNMLDEGNDKFGTLLEIEEEIQ
ncbi:hypothetical protein AGMMS49938_01480 [Fibrobacterales bacterium]|nr:hypothetical protein AGMMS49938_01480 [Fibrobacterales bacterium]